MTRPVAAARCRGKQWHCENRRAYACFSRGDATRHLCAISQTDNIACARAAPVTISHFEISARLQRTLFRCAATGRSIYVFSTSGYVKLVARMEAMTSPRIPSGYNVDSSTDEVVLCLFFVCRLRFDAFFCVKCFGAFASVFLRVTLFFVYPCVAPEPEITSRAADPHQARVCTRCVCGYFEISPVNVCSAGRASLNTRR